MTEFTMVINDQEMKKLKTVYHEQLTNISNQLVFFNAIHNSVEITGFTSGKLLIEGDNVDAEIELIKKVLNHRDFEAIGSNEVGSEDVFGPITVCAAYVSLDDLKFLEELISDDAKLLTDRFIIKHAPEIAKRLTHSLIILDPIKYNKLISEGYNLNRIRAHLHNQALVSLTDKLDNREMPVLVDQFCTPQLYFNYLKDEILIYRDVQFYPKAENIHIAVAAAKIIARYAFLYSMQNLNKKAGVRLLKGSSKKVDDQLEELVRTHGKAILKQVSKTNFKNVTKLNL